MLDDAAFASAFRTYYAPLCGFAFRYVRGTEAAEDLVQEAFAALWAGRRTLRITTSLRAYLFAAVRNRALNARKHLAVEADWARDEASDDVRALHPHPLRPDQLFDRAELEAELSAALDALPEKCSIVMRLRWREQLSYAEIAEVMETSTRAVEKQLERGLRALRALMT